MFVRNYHLLNHFSVLLKIHPNLTLNAPAAKRQDAIMGHARDDRASVYRKRVGDDRLRAVVDHVRTWLFGIEENK